MKKLHLFVAVVSLMGVLLPALPAGAQGDATEADSETAAAEIPSGDQLDLAALAAGLKDGDFWWVVVVTLVLGGLGGVVYELLILQGNIEWPHRPREEEVEEKYPYAVVEFLYDLGIFARVIIGALAAVIALWLLSPETTVSWLAVTLVAGSAGTSVFRSMQDRLLATIAQKDVSELRRKFAVQTRKLDEIQQVVKEQGGAPPDRLGGDEASQANSRVLELLAEARGVGDTVD